MSPSIPPVGITPTRMAPLRQMDDPVVPPAGTPKPTDPVPTDPVPTDPVPTDPVPTDPVPTDPVPTDPVPTDPVPTDPIPVPDEPELRDPSLGAKIALTTARVGDNVTEFPGHMNQGSHDLGAAAHFTMNTIAQAAIDVTKAWKPRPWLQSIIDKGTAVFDTAMKKNAEMAVDNFEMIKPVAEKIHTFGQTNPVTQALVGAYVHNIGATEPEDAAKRTEFRVTNYLEATGWPKVNAEPEAPPTDPEKPPTDPEKPPTDPEKPPTDPAPTDPAPTDPAKPPTGDVEAQMPAVGSEELNSLLAAAGLSGDMATLKQ